MGVGSGRQEAVTHRLPLLEIFLPTPLVAVFYGQSDLRNKSASPDFILPRQNTYLFRTDAEALAGRFATRVRFGDLKSGI